MFVRIDLMWSSGRGVESGLEWRDSMDFSPFLQTRGL